MMIRMAGIAIRMMMGLALPYVTIGWLTGQLLPHVFQALDPRLVDALSIAFEGACTLVFGSW